MLPRNSTIARYIIYPHLIIIPVFITIHNNILRKHYVVKYKDFMKSFNENVLCIYCFNDFFYHYI